MTRLSSDTGFSPGGIWVRLSISFLSTTPSDLGRRDHCPHRRETRQRKEESHLVEWRFELSPPILRAQHHPPWEELRQELGGSAGWSPMPVLKRAVQSSEWPVQLF
jgi:hypothetical protein